MKFLESLCEVIWKVMVIISVVIMFIVVGSLCWALGYYAGSQLATLIKWLMQ